MATLTLPPSHPSDRAIFLIATGVCLTWQSLGGPLTGPSVTGATCVLMLLFGLPHGSLDLELLKGQHALSARQLLLTLGLYVLLASAMLAVWWLNPLLALIVFISVSIVHFAEDWLETGSRFLATGFGAALLASPTVFHGDQVSALFIALVGEATGRLVADLLKLIAPVCLLIATVGLHSLWNDRQRRQALDGACAILAMLALPPAVGFALFFCLLHSPRHLRSNLHALGTTRRGGTALVVISLTAAGIGIASSIYGLITPTDWSTDVVRASFMTLSVLVIPHLAVPWIAAASSRAVVVLAWVPDRRQALVANWPR